MDDPERGAVEVTELVGVVEPLQDLERDERHERLAEPTRLLQEPTEGLPLQVLHRDEVLAAGLPRLVGVDDVRMVQACGEARLVEQHLDQRHVPRVTEALHDGELVHPLRPVRESEKDVGHPAFSEAGDGRVPAHHLR